MQPTTDTESSSPPKVTASPPSAGSSSRGDIDESKQKDYWRRNVQIVLALLAVWAFVSFGCGIILAPWLNQFTLPLTHYPLGFWFAQQGSILTFVALVFTYVFLMNRLEHEEGMD